MEPLKVSAHSNPGSVAGAMAGVIRQTGSVVVQVVGAGAVNQAIKAVAIARGFVSSSGVDLVCTPSFVDVEIDGEHRTAIRLCIESRRQETIARSALPTTPPSAVDFAPLGPAGWGPASGT